VVFDPYVESTILATLSFYLADEVRASNVAVNAVFPAHTRTTGSDEQEEAFAAMGARSGAPRMVPEHVVPLVLFLAGQDARSLTGRLFDALQWNIEHGLGGPEQWRYRA
jgi:NAD(P)-dependent dehydrogenase (short-subunit alcohol dehydrogenase family)